MIHNKEKLRIFRILNNPKQATADLKLLMERCPANTELHKFQRNPERYAGDILYALIDVATEQLISDNRISSLQSQGSIVRADASTGASTDGETPSPQAAVPPQQTQETPKKKPSRKKKSFLRFLGTTFLT